MENKKRNSGRPAHVPTEISRRMVAVLAAQGVPQREICRVVTIDEKTLRKRYRHELNVGAAKLEAALALHLFRLSNGKGAVALRALQFCLQCRFGWSLYVPPPRG